MGDTDAEPEGVAESVVFAVAESAAVGEAEAVMVAEVVAQRPRSLQALAEISGIGQAKLDRYGPALLEALELGLTAGAGGSPAG